MSLHVYKHTAENNALCEAAVESDDDGIEPCEAPAVAWVRYNDDGDYDPHGHYRGLVCARHTPAASSTEVDR